MTARADILAGRAVILVNIQDTIDAQLRTIRGKMRAFTNSISEIGGDLFRGGLAGSIGSALPVKSFTDFQDSMLFLQAKLKDTGVDVQQLEKYIRHLGRTTSFTSKEVAEGAAVLAQAGLGERVQAALLPTLDLARSERVDMETAGRILANTMMAFAIPSEKAAETASKLTTATRLGTTDLVLMAESLKYLQTTARSLNMGFEETLGLVVQLSNVGSRGSTAGTSLNAALSNLAAKPIQLKEKLGITFTPEEVQDTVKMLAKIRDATKEMDALERKAVMSSLFNIRGERGFQGAILAGLDELQKNIDLIKASTDEVRITSELLDSRLGGVWRRAKSAFEEMGLAIGETTEGPLTKFGSAAQKVFEDLSHLATVNPKIVQTLLIIPPAAIAAGAGLLLLSTAMSKVIMLIGPLLSVNAMIFKTIAAIVGTNVKMIKSGLDGITVLFAKNRNRTGPSINASAGIMAISHTARSGIVKAATATGKVYRKALTRFMQTSTWSTLTWAANDLKPLALTAKYVGRALASAAMASQGGFEPQSFQHILNGFLAIKRQWPVIKNVLSDTAMNARILGLNFTDAGRDIAGSGLNKVRGTFQRMGAALRGATLEKAFTSPIATSITKGVAKGLISINKVLDKSTTLKGISKVGQALIGRGINSSLKVAPLKLLKEGLDDLGKGTPAKGLFALLKAIGGGFRALGRSIVTTNWLARFISGFKTLGTALRIVWSGLNGIRRVLFSLSGWLTIVEILILFGDKIPVVKDILEGLGNAFKNVFANIGQTLRNLSPSLNLVTDGIRDMFSGESMLGVQKIKAGFQDIANIISTGLNHAWQQFVADMKPGSDLIKEALGSVIATFNLVVDMLGNIFGGIISGGKLVLSGEGGFIEQIKGLFSQENRQEIYKFIGGFLAEMTKGILRLVATITRVALEIKFALFSMVGYVQHAMAVLVEGFASAPSALTGLSDKDQQRLFIQSLRMRGSGDEFLSEVSNNRFSSISALDDDLKSRTRSIDQSLGEFLGAIKQATTDIKPNTAEAKAAADAAALAARFRPSAIAIGNALGRPLAALNSFLLPGSLRPRQPVLTVPETGRQVGGGRGFNIMGTAEMQEAALSLMEGLKKAFGSQTPEPPALAEAKAEAAKIGQAVKAVVGDFESTRGQKIQFRSEKLQEKTNEILDAIQAGVEPLAGLLEKQPRFA